MSAADVAATKSTQLFTSDGHEVSAYNCWSIHWKKWHSHPTGRWKWLGIKKTRQEKTKINHRGLESRKSTSCENYLSFMFVYPPRGVSVLGTVLCNKQPRLNLKNKSYARRGIRSLIPAPYPRPSWVRLTFALLDKKKNRTGRIIKKHMSAMARGRKFYLFYATIQLHELQFPLNTKKN